MFYTSIRGRCPRLFNRSLSGCKSALRSGRGSLPPHFLVISIRPFQGRCITVLSHPWAMPTAIQFVPCGDTPRIFPFRGHGYLISPLRGHGPNISFSVGTAIQFFSPAGPRPEYFLFRGRCPRLFNRSLQAAPGRYFFRTIQFDIDRMCCTTTVLNGSSHSPPRASVVAKSISSSTRKRVLPSGRR